MGNDRRTGNRSGDANYAGGKRTALWPDWRDRSAGAANAAHVGAQLRSFAANSTPIGHSADVGSRPRFTSTPLRASRKGPRYSGDVGTGRVRSYRSPHVNRRRTNSTAIHSGNSQSPGRQWLEND